MGRLGLASGYTPGNGRAASILAVLNQLDAFDQESEAFRQDFLGVLARFSDVVQQGSDADSVFCRQFGNPGVTHVLLSFGRGSTCISQPPGSDG